MMGINLISDNLLSGFNGRFFYASFSIVLVWLLPAFLISASASESCEQIKKLNSIQQEISAMLQLDKTINQLCAKGLTNKAQNQAYVIAQEIQNSPALLALKLCATQNKLNTMQQKIMARYAISNLRFIHVCDVK